MTETLTTNADGRNVLRMERRLSHPPEKVWRALTEPKEFSQWFPAAATHIDAHVGGVVRLDLGSDPHLPGDSTQDLPITEATAPSVFEFAWEEEVLRWELRPAPDGCLLIFTHTFDDRAGAASFASGWQMCFDAFEALLAGQPLPVTPPSATLHDTYVATFGLDTGIVEDTGNGWQVRFERQLTAPAATAWAALTDDATAVGATPPAAVTSDAVPAGKVTTADAPAVLEYQWLTSDRPSGTVRWELRDENGTGHGARLYLTQTGGTGATAERDAALQTWPARIQRLAEQLR